MKFQAVLFLGLILFLNSCITVEKNIDKIGESESESESDTKITDFQNDSENSSQTKSFVENLYDDHLLIPSEGGVGKLFNDGASWEYWNKGAHFKWKNLGGDYYDKNLDDQGDKAWAMQTVSDTDSIKKITWDVKELVQYWLNNISQNKGMHLRYVSGAGGPIDYATREVMDSSKHPKLKIQLKNGTEHIFTSIGDSYLSSSTKTITFGKEEKMRVNNGTNALLWFDISSLEKEEILSAVLEITSIAQYTSSDTVHGIFATKTSQWDKSSPILGLASQYKNDKGVRNHPDVYVHYSFDTQDENDGKSFLDGSADLHHRDNIWPCDSYAPAGKQVDGSISQSDVAIPGYKPFGEGNALCSRLQFEEGAQNTQGIGNYGMSLRKKVKDFMNQDQTDELYVRIYLYLGETWGENILNESGKRPGGISGTQSDYSYAAGWGGRTTNGANGWSTRGGYFRQVPYGNNPLEGYTPLASYIYHADQTGGYGDSVSWDISPNGLIKKGRWYCIEQQVKMNTRDGNNIKGSSGAKDGILRGWVDGRLVFERTNLRFTDMDYINIDTADFGLYFGGFGNTPYDQHMAIDNIIIAKSYIGPMNK